MFLCEVDGHQDVYMDEYTLQDLLERFRRWGVREAFIVREDGTHLEIEYQLARDENDSWWSGYRVIGGTGLNLLLVKRFVQDWHLDEAWFDPDFK